MGRLTESDYRGALSVLREAVAVDGPVPFPEPVLEALRRLLPCDVVAYHDQPRGQAAVAYVGEPRRAVTPEMREAERRLVAQDPLTPGKEARKYSDFLSRREFRRLEYYWEVVNPLGVEDMMRLWLDPSSAGEARLEFDRPRRDFRERDRAVLDVLQPHLKELHRRATARRRLPGPGRLTPREREILELVAGGRTNAEVARLLWISPGTVRKHLENAYGKLGVHTRAGAVAVILRN